MEIITCGDVKDLKLDVLVKRNYIWMKNKKLTLLKVESSGQPSKFQVFEDLIREKCHVPFSYKKWWWIEGVHMSHV